MGWISISSDVRQARVFPTFGVWPGAHFRLWWPLRSQEWFISNFSCSPNSNITSHSMKNLAFHSLLGWKMIILTNSHYLTYTFLFLRVGRMYFLNKKGKIQTWHIKGPWHFSRHFGIQIIPHILFLHSNLIFLIEWTKQMSMWKIKRKIHLLAIKWATVTTEWAERIPNITSSHSDVPDGPGLQSQQRPSAHDLETACRIRHKRGELETDISDWHWTICWFGKLTTWTLCQAWRLAEAWRCVSLVWWRPAIHKCHTRNEGTFCAKLSAASQKYPSAKTVNLAAVLVVQRGRCKPNSVPTFKRKPSGHGKSKHGAFAAHRFTQSRPSSTFLGVLLFLLPILLLLLRQRPVYPPTVRGRPTGGTRAKSDPARRTCSIRLRLTRTNDVQVNCGTDDAKQPRRGVCCVRWTGQCDQGVGSATENPYLATKRLTFVAKWRPTFLKCGFVWFSL